MTASTKFADLGWAHAKLDTASGSLHIHTPHDTGTEPIIPAAYIYVGGRDALRALADLLAPYQTPVASAEAGQ